LIEVREINSIESKKDIHNIIRNNLEKYISILFVFGEKIKISNLKELLSKKPEEIQTFFNTFNDKIEIL
jgi:hypothetical protein